METTNLITLSNIRQKNTPYSVVVRRRVSFSNTKIKYVLEEPLNIMLSNGLILNIPKGVIWDLSSVPRSLWGILPPDGDFEVPSLIHDYLYINKIGTRKFADEEMLLWSKTTSGTQNKWSIRNLDNQVRFIAVRLFGWLIWNRKD